MTNIESIFTVIASAGACFAAYWRGRHVEAQLWEKRVTDLERFESFRVLHLEQKIARQRTEIKNRLIQIGQLERERRWFSFELGSLVHADRMYYGGRVLAGIRELAKQRDQARAVPTQEAK